MQTDINNEMIIINNQQLRQRLIDDAMKDGVPKDIEERKFIASLLNSSDHTAVSLKRIKADEEKANNTAQMTTEVISAVLRQMHGRTTAVPGGGAIPVIDEPLVENVTIADGELEIGVSTNDYNTFIQPHLKKA